VSTIIKPCPFCGGSDIDEAFVRSYKSGDQSQPIIAAGCHSCGASGPDTNVPDHSTGYKESINKWNDRAEVERLQARVAEKCDAPVGWIGPDKYRTARESKMKFFKTIKELREQNEKLHARVAELESDEQEMAGDNNV
jgi:Lar family restriction alleviation protein